MGNLDLWDILGLFIFAIYTIYERYKGKSYIEDLTKKCVFITGCDTGFGNAIARTLDKKGCQVIAGCFSPKGAEELKRISSKNLSTVIIDISSTKSIQEEFEKIKTIIPSSGKFIT